MKKHEPVIAIAALALLAGFCGDAAGQNPDDVRIESTRVAEGIYMLTGRGGNMGLCVGDDGPFLIDDQFAPLTGKIVAAIARLTDKPVRFVINTHWHGDHTGGNENLGKRGVVIVAHDNVRKRMSSEQFIKSLDRTVPPAPAIALPVVTFADSITFHLNGQTIEVFHVPPAHTDGDCVICFRGANVIHSGDVLFNGMYPFIDASAGGNLDGMVHAADRILKMSNDTTRIIPGHGPLAHVKELRAYRDMLAAVSQRVHALHDEGKTRDQIIAAHPTAPYDSTWGGGFLKPDQWVGIVCDSLGFE